MEKFKRFFIILAIIVFAGLLHAQTPVELGEYVSCDRFCSADCGGQETIYFEPSTGYIVTTAIKDRADVYSYTSMDGGATWSAVSPVNTGGEVRTVSVSGDANSPIFIYSKRGDTPTTAPWARHVTYIATDDFGWGGGSYSEAPVADAGTETDVMDSYYPHFDISPFDANLRGVASHHGSSQEGGEYQQFFCSLDGGQTWSEHIKVVIKGDKDTLNYVGDLKTLTFDFQYAPNGVILAAGVAEPAAGGYERLWYSMSADSGQTWGDVNFIAAADSIEVDWNCVDRGYKVFLDADNNFHVFALGRGTANSGLYKAYDFKLTGETWTGNCIAEPMLIDKGFAAIEAGFGDAAPLNAPTLNVSDGTIFYSFIDVADTTGGVNDYRLYTIYSTDGGAVWSDRVELISDPEFQAEEFVDVARTANDKLHITYCKIEASTITQYYLQLETNEIMSGQGPLEIEVQAGTDQISAALAGAGNGDVLILVTDGGEYVENDSLVIDKKVTIKAADGLSNPPVWTTLDSTQSIYLKTDLTLKGITFNGRSITVNAISSDAPTPNQIIIDECNFINYADDMINGEVGTTSDSVFITNCYFENGGDEDIEFQGDKDNEPYVPGVHYLKVENCTFTSSNDEGDAIKVYGRSSGSDSAVVFINHVTIYGGDRGIYLRYVDTKSTLVTNSIITKCAGEGVRMRAGGTPTTYSDVFDNGEDFANDASAGEGTISADPMFADSANGDFDLQEGSPCINTASDGENMGDTNWGVATSITSEVTQPVVFALLQNYPNPFNPATTIKFELTTKSTISLVVYNIVGEKIATLINNKMFSPGLQEIEWNAADFASGVYFYQLKTAGESCITRKMILLK